MRYVKIAFLGIIVGFCVWIHNLAVFQIILHPERMNSFGGFIALVVAVVIVTMSLRPDNDKETGDANKEKKLPTGSNNKITYFLIAVPVVFSFAILGLLQLFISLQTDPKILINNLETILQITISLIFAIIVDITTNRFKDAGSRISWYGAIVLLITTLTQFLNSTSA